MTEKDLSYYMSLPYKVEILPEEGEASFTAVIPDLKGCMAFAETIQEAVQMVTEAKQLWIETALDKGWPVPEPEVEEIRSFSGRFNVRLPRYLHRKLADLAQAEGTSLNQLVVALLAEGAERRQQRTQAIQWASLSVADAHTLAESSSSQEYETPDQT